RSRLLYLSVGLRPERWAKWATAVSFWIQSQWVCCLSAATHNHAPLGTVANSRSSIPYPRRHFEGRITIHVTWGPAGYAASLRRAYWPALDSSGPLLSLFIDWKTERVCQVENVTKKPVKIVVRYN